MKALSLLIPWALAMDVFACGHFFQVTRVRPTRAPSAPAQAPAVAASRPEPAAAAPDSFAARVEPILQARCQPCHFAGGKMYARLPFDRAETVVQLREKLFTRIKNEDERRTIRAFLAMHPAAPAPLGS